MRTRKNIRSIDTFTIPGTVAIASGSTDFVPLFFADCLPGEIVRMTRVTGKVRAYSSQPTVKLQRNGVDIPGYTGIVLGTTPIVVAIPILLNHGDQIAYVVTGAGSSADGVSFTIDLDRSIV